MQSTKLYLLDTEELQNKMLFNKYFSTVSQNRQEKIMHYRFLKDRTLSLGAGILIDKGLQAYGLNEHNMQYSITHNEKPYFTHYPDIHFNISHSGKYVICAFGPCEVGCDIEILSEIDLKIAHKFFYHSEYRFIADQENEKERQEAFFRLWTLKESFMKITGYGMSLPLDAFRIYFKNNQIYVSQNVNTQPYHFHEYECDSNYKIACCSHMNHFDDSVSICSL